MTWRIAAVGKPRLPYALAGIAEYERRIRRFARVDWRIVPASDARRESLALLETSKGQLRLLLDPRGTQFTSREFAAKVENWALFSPQAVTLLVGGADGVTDEVRAQADLLWSLSRQTLPHELALLVALEQIYRAHTILAGQPYHRE
ncbi:MAG: 23S rRNA (pseudouridine(1915)-N(3))-methyltransferase RlmH [Verrucomicrobia bacterium]|nr:23S rRNA (pseudouridine(1915)-N(3))-methyltransferase RlmH [Verrucomicrobiota bacterium]